MERIKVMIADDSDFVRDGMRIILSVDEEFDYSYDNLGFRLRRFLVTHFGEDFTCEMVDGGDMACTYLINGNTRITYYAGDDSVEFEGNRYYLSE